MAESAAHDPRTTIILICTMFTGYEYQHMITDYAYDMNNRSGHININSTTKYDSPRDNMERITLRAIGLDAPINN